LFPFPFRSVKTGATVRRRLEVIADKWAATSELQEYCHYRLSGRALGGVSHRMIRAIHEHWMRAVSSPDDLLDPKILHGAHVAPEEQEMLIRTLPHEYTLYPDVRRQLCALVANGVPRRPLAAGVKYLIDAGCVDFLRGQWLSDPKHFSLMME